MNKQTPTNEELVELLSYFELVQTKALPEHLTAFSFMRSAVDVLDPKERIKLTELVVERLSGIVVEPTLSRKEELALATDLAKELQNKATPPPLRDFFKGYEKYGFPLKVVRNAISIHPGRHGGTGCIVVSLGPLIDTHPDEPVVATLAGIGVVLAVLTRDGVWPVGVADPKHIFWLMHQQITLDSSFHIVTGKNPALVLGHPVNFQDHVPGANRNELQDIAEQMKEIGQEYPGWVLSSDPVETL